MRILSLVFCLALSCFLIILLLVFLPLYCAIALSLHRKIFIKVYLTENKEVTLFVQLNW